MSGIFRWRGIFRVAAGVVHWTKRKVELARLYLMSLIG